MGPVGYLFYRQKWNPVCNNLCMAYSVTLQHSISVLWYLGSFHFTNTAGPSSLISKGTMYIETTSNTTSPSYSTLSSQCWGSKRQCPKLNNLLVPLPLSIKVIVLGVPNSTAVGRLFWKTSWSLWDRMEVYALGWHSFQTPVLSLYEVRSLVSW